MEFQKYFQFYDDYFWMLQWYRDDFGESIFTYEILDGTTIAYSDFVLEILELLSEQSIPPLGSLLLAILATNPESDGAIETVRQFAKSNEKASSFPNANLYRVGAAIDFLNILASMPPAYKTGNKRLRLFQTIFENCHNRLARDKAKTIIQDFKNNEYDFCSKNVKIAFSEANFTKDFRTIALLKVKFPTVQSLLEAMEGLPDEDTIIIEEAVVEQDQESEKAKDFVDQLIEENKTFHVGSLIKRIWSGLNIPLHHNTPSQQPLGGISDLTNKGDFDKLLISEFANDDVIFMSRLANNEALYIQREIPPEDDKFKRILLIDSTLKNWGNPKVVGFATALAIVKHPKTDIECDLFVLGSDFKQAYCDTIHQVIDGLSHLSGQLDCSDGLESYFRQIENDKDEKELFLILSEQSLAVPGLQRVLHENFESLSYLITTSVEGEINFYKIKNRGKKLVQKIRLSLGELWQPKHGKKSQSVSANEEMPMLYPLERSYEGLFSYNSVFYRYHNGALFSFGKGDQGFQKLASGIPVVRHGEFALYENSNKESVLMNLSRGILSSFTIATKEHQTRRLDPDVMGMNFLFTHEGHCYGTDRINYWQITQNCETIITNDRAVRERYDGYEYDLEVFKKRYKSSKNKYNIIRNLNNVCINTSLQYMEVNGYTLTPEGFSNQYPTHYHDFHELPVYVNLVLKHRGRQPLKAIKIIKDELGLSLHEAKAIVDENLSKIVSDVPLEYAEDLKQKVEGTGAVCYIEVSLYKSDDGSTIENKDGILIFESSDKSIQNFYVTSILNRPTAMSTHEEFAGNDFFFPENGNLAIIETAAFYQKHIKPFIKTILDYGT